MSEKTNPEDSFPELDPERIYECIKEGVSEAFSFALGFDREKILDAVQWGVKEAFDQLWASQIQNAITDGVKEAMSR